MCGLLLLALLCSLVLRRDAPVIAFLLVLAAGLMLLARAAGQAAEAGAQLLALLEQNGVTQTLYLPVLRAMGIAVVVRILASHCRDAGQSALAVQTEIAGAVLALAQCLPLAEQVLELAAGWVV